MDEKDIKDVNSLNIAEISEKKPGTVPGTVLSDKKRFEIYSKRIFLTYSRAPDSWTKEYLRDRLVNDILMYKNGQEKYKTKVRAYVIAQEKHQRKIGRGDYERGDKHFHCLIEGKDKIKILNERELDIDGVHGQYEVVENVWAVLNYVKKECNWIAYDFPGIEGKERNILEAPTDFEAKLQLMNRMKPAEQLKLREEFQKMNQNNQTAKLEMEEIKRIKIEIPFKFKRELEPYIQQLMGKNRGGFNLEGRPMGIILYGKSGVGKSSWRKDLERILKEKIRCVNSFRAIADRYEKETIIVLDEFKGSDFKRYAKEIKLMITEDQCETLPYKKVVDLAWPRRILICTNEDVEKWEWTEGMRERFLIIEIKGPEDYQLKLWRQNVYGIWILEDKTLEETMEYLGFEIKEVKEIKTEELGFIEIIDSDRN